MSANSTPSVDILILNTAVVDFRGPQFGFTADLAGQGGLAKCQTKDMPDYSQEQLKAWIDQGHAATGGQGNSAPLMSKAGLSVAVGANVGKGDYNGFDAPGDYFNQVMIDAGVKVSDIYRHQELPTGMAFIHDCPDQERGGIAYFPNANNDFDFSRFQKVVDRLDPKIVFYMYSGLSQRGDANGGRDLAEFMRRCRQQGRVTIADSHTLTANPEAVIRSDAAVKEYELLEPLLPELDIFFTSYDEARMIENTLGQKGKSKTLSENEYICHFLDFLAEKYFTGQRTQFFGVTVSDGAFIKWVSPQGQTTVPTKITSRFLAGEVIDLVGAGDSFRAGLQTYVARHLDAFHKGSLDFTEAVQMANLFAALYIKAPLQDRYGYIKPYEQMLGVMAHQQCYTNFDDLLNML